MGNKELIFTLERLYRYGGTPDAALVQTLVAFLETISPGPWRWSDWSATFGTEEDPEHRYTLETALESPVVEAITAESERFPEAILSIEDEVENPADKDFLVIARMAVPLLLRAITEGASPAAHTERLEPTRPLRTRSGRPARVVCNDAQRGRFSLLALVTVDGIEEPRFFDQDGRSAEGIREFDLVND